MDYIQQMQRSGSLNPVTGAVSYGSQSSQPSQAAELNELKEAMLLQKNHFERFVQITKGRIQTLEKEVSELREELTKAQAVLEKISDKATVQRSREALLNRKDRPPSDTPIDRNGVAPKDVSIDKIFNCSHKRF